MTSFLIEVVKNFLRKLAELAEVDERTAKASKPQESKSP